MNLSKKQLVFIALILIGFGASVRLLPHAPNSTPITAIAFVSSLYLGRRWALILPLSALFLSDMLVGLYDWRIMLSVYGSFALIGAWSWLSKRSNNPLSVTMSVIGASTFFFLTTNAAVWLFSPWYEKSIAGLMYAYTLGLPFFRNMLAGDIVYTALFVGAFESCRYIILNSTSLKNVFLRLKKQPIAFVKIVDKVHGTRLS